MAICIRWIADLSGEARRQGVRSRRYPGAACLGAGQTGSRATKLGREFDGIMVKTVGMDSDQTFVPSRRGDDRLSPRVAVVVITLLSLGSWWALWLAVAYSP